MSASPPIDPKPGTPPSCAFCGTPLSEAAWFKYEMELAAFEAQSPLAAPEVGNHNPIDRIPLTYCDECRESVRDNAVARQREEEYGDIWSGRMTKLGIGAVMVICFLILLAEWLTRRR